jgi:DNA-binding MarR family transcriptional regulator
MNLEDEIKQKSFTSPYHRMAVNIMFTGNWLHKELASTVKPFGVSLQQHNVLSILRGQHPNPCMLGIIQERMLDRESNATRLVDKLLEKGLVNRCQCPGNRRKVDIVITDKGLELLKQIDAVIKDFQSRFGHLTEEEATLLGNLLDKVRQR